MTDVIDQADARVPAAGLHLTMFWLVRRGWKPLRLIGITVLLGVVGKILSLPVKAKVAMLGQVTAVLPADELGDNLSENSRSFCHRFSGSLHRPAADPLSLSRL